METLGTVGVGMIKLSAGDMREIASAQVLRNTRFNFLIDQANKLPYCKRNIMLMKLFFWDITLDDLISSILNNIKGNKRKVDANQKCLDYLLENNLAQKEFTEFFFRMHSPLTRAFLNMIAQETANGLSIPRKIRLIVIELTELLNIALIELEGIDLECKMFVAKPLCIKFNVCGIPECQNVSNVYTVVICKEYFLEPGLFDEIIEAVGDSIVKEGVIMVVDYTNMRKTMHSYDWGKTGGLNRFEISKDKVKALYFYNTEGFVDFGKFKEKFAPYIIPDKKGLKLLKDTWRTKKELTYFA